MSDKAVERVQEYEVSGVRMRLEVRYSGSDDMASALAEKWGEDLEEVHSGDLGGEGGEGDGYLDYLLVRCLAAVSRYPQCENLTTDLKAELDRRRSLRSEDA